MCSPCLPAEVWTYVFRLLSLSDRLRVRASCKYFRDLVDSALWRNWTVELRSSGEEYEEDFWLMLRHLGVTSARLSSTVGYEFFLTHIAKGLPGLTTLILNIECFTEMKDLRSFINLERLHVVLHTRVRLEELSLVLPQGLMHLTVCSTFCYETAVLPAEISPDSSFKKLKSLVYHCDVDSHPVDVLHFFLSSLPELQHLSLKTYSEFSYEGNISDLPPLQNCSLSSLELMACETQKFPMDFMKMLSKLTFLRSLAIFCQYDCADEDELDDSTLKLSSWLRDLPALTSLVVRSGNVRGFVQSIPSSVTRLIFLPLFVDSWTEDMSALSEQLPDLHHLHLEPYDDLGSATALIPGFFPRLKTLRLYHKRVPEDAFLSLGSLQELEVLETVDEEPLPAALFSKFRELTNNRVRIYNSPEDRWLWTCDCSYYISTDYWA
uniref:F-box domain-containing protein n=1 Tax=Neogobius melanostomus TaxID=47308 RepID=A0A8C6TAL2_9GOBI